MIMTTTMATTTIITGSMDGLVMATTTLSAMRWIGDGPGAVLVVALGLFIMLYVVVRFCWNKSEREGSTTRWTTASSSFTSLHPPPSSTSATSSPQPQPPSTPRLLPKAHPLPLLPLLLITSLLIPQTKAYVPAIPVNDTSALNLTDDSSLNLKWGGGPGGVYSARV